MHGLGRTNNRVSDVQSPGLLTLLIQRDRIRGSPAVARMEGRVWQVVHMYSREASLLHS